MSRNVLIVVSTVAMITASVGVSAASAAPPRGVTATAKPTLTGGALDANNNLKVYGGQTAANVSSGSSLRIDTQTQRNVFDVLGFASYGYVWFRYDGSTYTAIPNSRGAARNGAVADVGYRLLVRQRPCYADPIEETLNICATALTTPDLSWSEPSAKVTFFASTDPTVSTIVADKISLTTQAVWQGYVPGSTKSFQWQSCTGNGTGCSDIGGATARKLTLTSAQNDSYIRAKITLATTQGQGVSADAYSNAVGYNLVPW